MKRIIVAALAATALAVSAAPAQAATPADAVQQLRLWAGLSRGSIGYAEAGVNGNGTFGAGNYNVTWAKTTSQGPSGYVGVKGWVTWKGTYAAHPGVEQRCFEWVQAYYSPSWGWEFTRFDIPSFVSGVRATTASGAYTGVEGSFYPPGNSANGTYGRSCIYDLTGTWTYAFPGSA